MVCFVNATPASGVTEPSDPPCPRAPTPFTFGMFGDYSPEGLLCRFQPKPGCCAEVHMPYIDMEPSRRFAFTFVSPECTDPRLYIRLALECHGGDGHSIWPPPLTVP